MTTAPAAPGSSPRPASPVTVGAQLWTAVAATVALGLALAVVASVRGGLPAAIGVGTGFAMVLVFFASGAVVVNAVAALSPVASLLVALLTYTLEVVLVAVVFLALERSGALHGPVDRTWAGIAVIVATLGWSAAHIAAATRSRQPLYDLSRSTSGGPEASTR